MTGFRRIGLAVEPLLSKNPYYAGKCPTRQYEYGIYLCEEAYGVRLDPPALSVVYEGYRELRSDGEARVGIALGGPGWRPPSFMPFNNRHWYVSIRFFEDGPWKAFER